MNKEFKRALAYITEIDELKPIPNYDRVEHARVKGWWTIVKKGEFQVGDKAVYFEVDSKVPFIFRVPKSGLRLRNAMAQVAHLQLID